MSSRTGRRAGGVVHGRGLLPVLLAAWFLAEVVVFAVVVHVFGVLGALLIGLATSVAGVAFGQRLGRSAAAQMRAAARGRNLFVAGGAGLTDGLLQALAVVLLLLPGFLSDALGAALVLAPVRTVVRRLLTRGAPAAPAVRTPREPDVVDLQPRDWHRLDGR